MEGRWEGTEAAQAWANVTSIGRTSRTYQVVLGEYDRSELEGSEQVIPINAGDLFCTLSGTQLRGLRVSDLSSRAPRGSSAGPSRTVTDAEKTPRGNGPEGRGQESL